MYWAIVTMTTVGYGDFVPQIVLGRLLAGVVMLL
ncbi:ion channel [Synechococcus sp. GEYO]